MNARKAFLTVAYSGLFPKAPGTFGTFTSLLLAILLLQYIPTSTLLLLSILITLIAVKQIDIYEKEVKQHDSKEIVVDELVGIWITLSICRINEENMLIMSILAFIFFRLFDIWKPSLIGKIDKKVKGGWGVMGDDILAGVFAGICTAGTYQIIQSFILNS
ncbi:MAG: phosphatidylglycerophosphatase A [Arcobacter sp.]|nr:phosphatidylglycerophosphatase A [Arcobacter sp.]